MNEILPKPTTATILQVFSKEKITYEMTEEIYELICAVIDVWPIVYGRRYKTSVEKVITLLEEKCAMSIRKHITVKREPMKNEIKGVRADFVWYDDPLLVDEAKKETT